MFPSNDEVLSSFLSEDVLEDDASENGAVVVQQIHGGISLESYC